MSFWDFDTLLEMKDGDILFFDELLNGNPTTLNACLTLLEQRRMISGKKLPDIMIVAAANPQGMSPLTPQIKERFVWYDVKLNKEMMKKYLINKYQITNNMGDKFYNLVSKEGFDGYNFFTPRSIDKAINMILNDAPTPYYDIINPILEEMIKNPLEEEIKLSEDRILMPNEMIKWIDLIKYKK